MFKDEACEKQIVEFIGLRAKLQSYKMLDGSEDKNVRGDKECYKNEYLNSMTTENACLAGRNNIEK